MTFDQFMDSDFARRTTLAEVVTILREREAAAQVEDTNVSDSARRFTTAQVCEAFGVPLPPLSNEDYAKLKAWGHTGIRQLCLPPSLDYPLRAVVDRVCFAKGADTLTEVKCEAVGMIAGLQLSRDITRAEADALRSVFEGLAERRKGLEA